MAALLVVGLGAWLISSSDDLVALRSESDRVPVPMQPPPVKAPAPAGGERELVSPAGAATSDTGTLRVKVFRSPSLGVAGVTVLANNRRIGVTDHAGIASAALAPGRYTITLDAASLPTGMMPPALQSEPLPNHMVPDGFFARSVKIVADAAESIEIRTVLSASVVGSVVDTAGQSVAGCPVRLQSRTAGLQRLSMDAVSGEDGVFAFTAVPPGPFLLHAYTTGAAPTPISPAPFPERIEVPEGGRVLLSPMVCGDTRATIRGRLVDQDARPISAVQIVVYPHMPATKVDEIGVGLADVLAQATTDSGGQFEVAVPPGELVVQAHPEGSLLPLGDPLRLTKPIPPVVVRAGIGETSVGDLLGTISRPFTLHLKIETDEARVRAVDPTLKTVAPPDVFLAPAAAFSDESKWQWLRLKDGAATFMCETPSPPLLLVVRRRGFAREVRQIDPTPGSSTIELRYP